VGQGHPAPEEAAGGPHGGQIDISLREHAAAQKRRHLLGIECVMCRFAAMDRLHGEGMTAEHRNAFAGTHVGQYPVQRQSPQTTRSAREGAMA
jgi:hypothetical protein